MIPACTRGKGEIQDTLEYLRRAPKIVPNADDML
jgi:hypothetical protein